MTQFFNKTTEKEKRRLLRKNAPEAEALMWSRLKGKQVLGFKFRRQYSVGAYVIAFYSPALKLAVELDGDSHLSEEAKVYDEMRQAFIESFGIRFLRFTNEQVLADPGSVVRAINQAAQGASSIS